MPESPARTPTRASSKRGVVTSRAIACIPLLLLTGIVAWAGAGPTRPETATVSQLQDPQRSFRMSWRMLAADGWDDRIEDLLAGPEFVYYASSTKIGCLDPYTGKTLWVHPGAPRNSERSWRITLGKGRVFAVEYMAAGMSPPGPDPYHVRAFDATTGKLIWDQRVRHVLDEVICTSGDTVLVASRKGVVLAIGSRDGAIRWQKPWRKTVHNSIGGSAGVQLQAENGVGVAQIGGSRLLGFRLQDGSTLWEYRRGSAPGPGPEDGTPEGFALREGWRTRSFRPANSWQFRLRPASESGCGLLRREGAQFRPATYSATGS